MLSQYLEKEENLLRKKILEMGDKTYTAIEKSMACYMNMDNTLAEKIIEEDDAINTLESEVEAECIQIIARQQPVAHDLRELLSDMNIAKELERIADYAVSIAKIVIKLPKHDHDVDPMINDMANKCLNMLKEVMIDYAEQDAKKASNCALLDDEIDEMEHTLNHQLFERIKSDQEHAICCTYQLWVVHQLERIGDRVTNIAESVVFLSSGKVVNFD